MKCKPFNCLLSYPNMKLCCMGTWYTGQECALYQGSGLAAHTIKWCKSAMLSPKAGIQWLTHHTAKPVGLVQRFSSWLVCKLEVGVA